MKIRKYAYFASPEDVAAVIAAETVGKGKSEGWCGSLEEFRSVQEILRRFNIFYVDDFKGMWGSYGQG